LIHVTEKPPLRHSVIVETPGGNRYRWARDEKESENIISGLTYGSVAPGGYESCGCQLVRDVDLDYPDLATFSDIKVIDGTGTSVWEGRLEDAPKSSGNVLSVTPNALGWQAHMQDDNSVVYVYITRNLGDFGEASTARRIFIQADGKQMNGDFAVSSPTDDPALASQPSLYTRFDEIISVGDKPNVAEIWFYTGGGPVGSVTYSLTSNLTPHANHESVIWLGTTDLPADHDAGTDHNGGGTAGSTVTATDDDRRYVVIRVSVDPVTAVGVADVEMRWQDLVILGYGHPDVQGLWPEFGFYDGDVIAHAIDNWCPELQYTADSITNDTSFIIPELALRENGNVAEIVNLATRFSLRDWFVWNDHTVWLHDRGAHGTEWVSRADLDYTGPSAERAWNQIVVQFQDVDGSTRTIGPPGASTHTTSALLQDDDPENPANVAGLIRSPDSPLNVGITTQAIAEEIGRRFLEESTRLSQAGAANLGSYVEDSSGHIHPYSHVRAGDTVRFVNAQDTSARRIVKASQSDQDHNVSVDLDAPPEGIAALLERFGASLGTIGLG
jgi:hypothetical protein